MNRVYLDNNATTMIDPLVLEAMEPFNSGLFGNPNSLHSYGSEARSAMHLALDRLYAGIGASDDDDLVVNGCATEGNNTVVQGIYYGVIRGSDRNHAITSQIEHPSVTNAFRFLESLGVEVTYLPVNSDGIIDADTLAKAVRPGKTAFVSIMWANNETGLINPVKELAGFCREQNILFHTDAVQAVGKIAVDVGEVPVDFLTFGAHKFHGPKGVGGLFIRKGRKLPPLLHGGEQMGGLRGGTVNVAGMVGMALALERATENLGYENTEVRRLRDILEDAILSCPGTRVIGDRRLRTPNTILASFEGVEGEAFIYDLDRAGIAASTGSACASESLEPNPTFTAIGISSELAHTGVRFSLSRFTTENEIEYAARTIRATVERLRSISTRR